MPISNTPNLMINGVNTGIQYVRELQDDLSLDRINRSIEGDGKDSIIFAKDGKEYIAWGENLDVERFKDAMTAGLHATLDGSAIKVLDIEDEITSFGQGFSNAMDYSKKLVLPTLGLGVAVGAVSYFAKMPAIGKWGAIVIGASAVIGGVSAGIYGWNRTEDITGVKSVIKAGQAPIVDR